MVVKDVVTRWDSTLEMFESMLKIRPAIDRFMKYHCPPNQRKFQFKHWQGMKRVCQLFGKFRKETKLFSNTFTKISEIIPSAYYILIWFQQVRDRRRSMRGITVALTEAQRSSRERYLKYFKNMNCVQATFLDPRYKMNTFVNDSNNPGFNEHSFDSIRDALVAATKKYHDEKTAYERKVEKETAERRALDGYATIREEPLDEQSESSSSRPVDVLGLTDQEHKQQVRAKYFKPRLDLENLLKIVVDTDHTKFRHATDL